MKKSISARWSPAPAPRPAYKTAEVTVSSPWVVVHYTRTGPDHPRFMKDDNHNGVPNYIEKLAASANKAWLWYAHNGFKGPLQDYGMDSAMWGYGVEVGTMMLRMMAGIQKPNKGTVDIRGRVSAPGGVVASQRVSQARLRCRTLRHSRRSLTASGRRRRRRHATSRTGCARMRQRFACL